MCMRKLYANIFSCVRWQLSECASNNKCETTESMHQLSFSLAHTNHFNDMIIDENLNRQPLMRTAIIV
jgi:hypothetical protein